jgi:hypothetical protein
MIYSISEGLLDRFKKKSKKDKSNKQPDKKSSTRSNKQSDKESVMRSNEQYEQTIKAAKEFFNKYLPIFAKIANKEMSNSEICKKNFTITSRIDDEDDINFNKGYVSISFIQYNLWDIEPKARTDYDTSPAIREARKIHERILDAVREYCTKNNISMKFEYTGDWDDIVEDIYIAIENLNLQLKEHYMIFESVKFI